MIAETGRAAVHEIAARLGLDPREAAVRLITLSASGLPLLVGVECDPNGIRTALANAAAWGSYGGPNQPGAVPMPPMSPPSGALPAQGGPSGPHPTHGTPSGAYTVHGTPSGAYRQQPGSPSGPYNVHGTPSGTYPGAPNQGSPSGPYAPPAAPQPAPQYPPAQQHVGPASTPFPAADPMATWGPPQTSAWARGDQHGRPAGPPAAAGPRPAGPRTATVGTALETEGLEGERLSILLVEVVDPADFLFTAAGYRLQEGERAVVVHTELTNRGSVPFSSLPDLYLVLLTPDGRTVSKAPVSLSSRPPHRIGVQPGETAGGHTVYVLPEDLQISAVRWSPRPDADQHSLTWTIVN
ncbi:AsnC family protein [Goodfellowiella coeruleoviolacea]|uniref:AsnC family protein n=1 Tax=Goodfellowiella coeruleoviolacea TaxID=334858 RepID=A0AAE3GLJ3_9PSEU|nr:AsnC family protein [Goodfellowiella coeruleoviolacea]MCP2169524.1 hypothetical protein [Goodfellowiella coeruleoviolacea]